jgi:lysozyme family protein
MDIEQALDALLKVEGGYTNDPRDSGGETNWGVTKAVADAFGYTGSMKDMTSDQAKAIYRARYWIQPKFDQLYLLDKDLALMLFDIGVNMGQATGVKFLQRALNVLNQGGTTYPDMTVDGGLGAMSLDAVKKFIALRKDASVLKKLVNAQRAVKYIEIAEASPKNEAFEYGWIANRVL